MLKDCKKTNLYKHFCHYLEDLLFQFSYIGASIYYSITNLEHSVKINLQRFWWTHIKGEKKQKEIFLFSVHQIFLWDIQASYTLQNSYKQVQITTQVSSIWILPEIHLKINIVKMVSQSYVRVIILIHISTAYHKFFLTLV